MTEYYVIGAMSGSSLDGLDLCLTKFNHHGEWKFEILKAKTAELPADLIAQLSKSHELSASHLFKLDKLYGEWIGQSIKKWIDDSDAKIDFIGLHGHTVFHDPSSGYSTQIGSGAMVSLITDIPVVDNFRQKDILLGGQGAPLVPFGEKMLFDDIPVFINLGGIANISIHSQKSLAWDIAPCNQVLNHFASQAGLAFDNNGDLAKSGIVDDNWLSYLTSLTYFKQNPPKSLPNQWTAEVLKNAPNTPADALSTYTELLSNLIAHDIVSKSAGNKVMITGGGAYNSFLIREIERKLPPDFEIYLPDRLLIDQKEALIFGFLALMRSLNLPNTLSSATGASMDSCSGTLHYPY